MKKGLQIMLYILFGIFILIVMTLGGMAINLGVKKLRNRPQRYFPVDYSIPPS